MKFRHFCDGDRIKRTVEVFSVLKILMLELLTFAILFIKRLKEVRELILHKLALVLSFYYWKIILVINLLILKIYWSILALKNQKLKYQHFLKLFFGKGSN